VVDVMTWGIYKPRDKYSAEINMDHCRQGIWAHMRVHQCTNKVKVKRDGIGFCGLHDPVALKAKLDAKLAAYKAKAEVRQRMEDEATTARKLRENALCAIRQIVDGHNDPRALARTVLDGTYQRKESS